MMSNQRYPVRCPKCAHEFWATKSLAHEMGMYDGGCGSCPECASFLNLQFDKENQCMNAKPWEKYLEELKAGEIAPERRGY